VLIAVCCASSPIALCAFNAFCVLAVSLCIAVSFIVSAITDLQATAAAMADLEALSALSADWATTNAVAFCSLSALALTLCSNSGLGKYFLFFKLSSLLAIF